MHNDRHGVGKIGCHLLNSQSIFLGYLKQDCQYILGLCATYCGYQCVLLAMAVLVRQEREQVVLEGGLVNAQTLAHFVGQQHPVLCVSPLSPLPKPAQRVLVTTLKVVSVSEIVLTKATCCHRGRIQVFFQELGKRYGVPSPFCDKRIDVQYHAFAILGKPPPPADVQLHPPVPHREIRHCGRFRKAIGAQVLLVPRAVVSLIQVDVQHAGICYVLLALLGRERLRLHPHQFEEVQHPLRKKEAEVVLVELCLCSILIHDYKVTSFHGIYLNGRILFIISDTDICW